LNKIIREYRKVDGITKPRTVLYYEIVCNTCGINYNIRKSEHKVRRHPFLCSGCGKSMGGHKGTDGKPLPQTKMKKSIQSSWNSMIKRTTSVNSKDYHRYGGRGISIEFESFGNFYEWSIKNGWKDGLYIERDNNDGNYSEDNCSWKTPLQQAQNRTTGKKNKTGYAGVQHYLGRFKATLKYDGKYKSCGIFDTPKEAHKAYLRAKELNG